MIQLIINGLFSLQKTRRSILKMSSKYDSGYENVSRIADSLRQIIRISPTVGIVCGSGLGTLADSIKDPQVIPYEDIPGFPRSTVVSHKGNLVFGMLGGKPVVAMQGRFHMYEGYSKHEIAIPIRVMKLLGVHTLLISNAAGGLNRQYHTGDLVVIKDHISISGLALNNVLIGPNDERFGQRFIAVSDAYSSDLRKLSLKIANENGFGEYMHEGVYAFTGGPSYESPAECKMYLMVGADLVGMSTVPEVLFARHCGIKVFAISLVTNIAVLDVESTIKANHDEVVAVGEERAKLLQTLFTKMIENL